MPLTLVKPTDQIDEIEDLRLELDVNADAAAAAQAAADAAGAAAGVVSGNLATLATAFNNHVAVVNPHSTTLSSLTERSYANLTGTPTLGSLAAKSSIADADVATGAAVAWSKISKSGAVASDVGAINQTAGDARYLQRTGGTLSGALITPSAGDASGNTWSPSAGHYWFVNGVNWMRLVSSGANDLRLKSDVPITWSSSTPNVAGGDTKLYRSAAGVLATDGQFTIKHLGSATNGLLKYALLLQPSGALAANYGAFGVADGSGDVKFDVDGAGVVRMTDGTLKTVVFGAADSGGTGYKLLRVSN